MPNPWLSIPLADYEGHMDAPRVSQAAALADLFRGALLRNCPASVAVLGIAGGNGLNHIDPAVTKRVVGFDVNPDYIAETRRRYPAVELHCIDLSAELALCHPVDLVYAALVFEHAGTTLCLDNAISLAAPGGTLFIVLQLPGEASVTPSAFTSLQSLGAWIALVDPAWMIATLDERGFALEDEGRTPLPDKKAFWYGEFKRRA